MASCMDVPCSIGIPRIYILGRFDPWGCFHSFGESFSCTYDEAIKVCKETNEGREPWLRLGVHRHPVLSQLPSPPSFETLIIRVCSPDDSETIKSCIDIASRCLLEHGFKIKASRLSQDLLALAGGSSPVSRSASIVQAPRTSHRNIAHLTPFNDMLDTCRAQQPVLHLHASLRSETHHAALAMHESASSGAGGPSCRSQPAPC
jgi:hypothetical protein